MDSFSEFLPEATGFIVGTALKRNGKIDSERVARFVRAFAKSGR